MKEENKIQVVVDPGRRGGYVVCQDGQILSTHNLEEADFTNHLRALAQKHELLGIVEDCPPYIPNQKMTSSSGYKLGKSVGFLIGSFMSLGAEVELLKPRKWQSIFSDLKGKTGADRKQALKEEAWKLYPQFKPTLRTADCILMAFYHFNVNPQIGGK